MMIIKYRNTFFAAFISTFIFVSCFLLSGCEENPGEFEIGKEYIESQTKLNLIDTFTVNLSTVILDTINTSGTGILFVGNYEDDIFGKFECSSYFQIGYPGASSVESNDVYDSLCLHIKYSGKFFGDTTKSQRISVHQLTKMIELNDDGNLTSNSAFDYAPTAIGSFLYTPKPSSTDDSLIIKIDDTIGLDLFTKLKNSSETITSNENFIDYFHGLVLIADEGLKGSIIGFNSSDTKLVLYTRRTESTTEELNYEFALDDSTKQFNNIKKDLSATLLKNLKNQREELSSNQCNNLAFLQGGTGISIKLTFPTLKELLLFDRGTIAQAKFIFTPVENEYEYTDHPTSLYMQELDNSNRVVNVLLSSAISATLTQDELYEENSTYTFDLTNYLINELADSYIDPEKGLLITLPSYNLATGFSRLLINANNHTTKLHIYYLSY